MRANRARSRSIKHARARCSMVQKYGVCKYIETQNKTPKDAVNQFQDLPLNVSTIRNWLAKGGSRYFEPWVKTDAAAKSEHKGL